MTDEDLRNAGELVEAWAKHWRLEGRLDPIDRFAKNDLIERIALKLARPVKPAKKAQANG